MRQLRAFVVLTVRASVLSSDGSATATPSTATPSTAEGIAT
jgi:hypothetical protein